MMTASKPLRRALVLALTAAVLLVAGSSGAGSSTLAKVDAATNKWDSLDYTYKIITQKKGEDPTKLSLRMRMKYEGGHNVQITEISEPADMKGTKVLIKSPTQMYIYLPAMKKIRRIASHVTDKPFLGTALSAEDMTLTRYDDYYETIKSGEKGDHLYLALKAKSDEAPYPKLKLKVEKSRWLPKVIKRYNEKGKLLKTEKRDNYVCKNGFCTPSKMTFINHTNGMASVLLLTDKQINPKLSDRIFTKRYLLR